MGLVRCRLSSLTVAWGVHANACSDRERSEAAVFSINVFSKDSSPRADVFCFLCFTQKKDYTDIPFPTEEGNGSVYVGAG